MPFDVIPAIDLAGGRVVRLVQGRFDAVTDFGGEPLEVAHRFWREGARSLHVIDLDAARSGERPAAAPGADPAPGGRAAGGGVLQVGGGFRTEEAVDAAIALGVDRVLVGTVAFRDAALLERMVERHGARICVTADTLDGTVRVAGWAEDAGVQVVDAIRDLLGPRRRRLPGHGDRARRHARRSRPATAGGRAGRHRRHRARRRAASAPSSTSSPAVMPAPMASSSAGRC